MELVGERITLREWRADETDAMHRWLGDPVVTRFLRFGARTREDSAQHLAECIAYGAHSPRQRFYLAVELRATRRVIGDAGFEWTAPAEGELGYFLEPSHQGRGLASEAVQLILACAFRELAARVMRATCDGRNAASERVMQRAGMRREREREEPGRRVYRIAREEWLARV